MCGISGIIGWPGGFDDGLLTIKNMSNSLHHRGPDDHGVWFDKSHKIYFGHNRLSILDLSKAGKQPMHSHCMRFVITFNGEIYNHLYIRQMLEKTKKMNWFGTSDTETLLEAISCYGLYETLKLLRGMFSFCLFDKLNQNIYLVRDRLGEKPLYLLEQKSKFYAFASEISAFYKVKEFKPEINKDALSCYFKRGWIAAPLSIWNNVSKILPGNIVKLEINKNGHYSVKENKKFWDCSSISLEKQNNMFEGNFIQSQFKLEQLLFEVLEGQSLSDVPLGVFLSGGIDSTLITALMQKTSRKKIKTFSIGFSDKNYDESFFAGKIANYLNTSHIRLEARPKDAIDLIERMPFIYSEPFADSSQIPTTLLCGLVRNHVKVALSGDGGDELFSGYARYLFAQKYFGLLKKCPQKFRKNLVYFLKLTSPNVMNKFGSVFKIKRFGDKLHKACEVITLENFQEFYEAITTYWPDNSILLNSKSNIYQFTDQLGDLENMMLADQLNYLPNDILVKGDRASMSYGLETRAPLLDHKVVEFAWSLPREFRIQNNSGKRILREILYKHVPKKLVDRPKQGFSMPVNEWLRGALREWAEDLLSKRKLPDDGLLNGRNVRLIWNEHLSGVRNWEYKLWPVLMWQQWNLSLNTHSHR